MSGQLRTGVNAIPGVLRFVGDLAHDVDWFIHTWDWSQQKRPLNRGPYPRRETEPWMIERMVEAYRPRDIRVDDHNAVMASLSIPWDAGRSQFVGMHLCDEMRRTWCRDNNITHDVVMRIRPDMTYSRGNTLARWVELVRAAPRNVLWSAIADERRIDDVIWATRPETMTQVVGYWSCLQARGHAVIDPREFIDYLAEQGIEPRNGPQDPHDKVYAPIREESQWMDPVTEVGRIYATDLMLYSDVQIDDQGREIPTAEWLEKRRPWLDQM